MPRVTQHERRARTLKRPMVCRICGQEVGLFQRYYTWQKRVGGKQYTHVACGYPRPTMLSNRKTAQIEEALMSADLSSWAPELGDHDVSDLKSVLEEVADVAESVADEYEESADNMPESLQQGMQAEAMRDVAERLRDYAGEMRDWEPDETEPDYLSEDEAILAELPEETKQESHDNWVEATRADAQEKLDAEMPEYEG